MGISVETIYCTLPVLKVSASLFACSGKEIFIINSFLSVVKCSLDMPKLCCKYLPIWNGHFFFTSAAQGSEIHIILVRWELFVFCLGSFAISHLNCLLSLYLTFPLNFQRCQTPCSSLHTEQSWSHGAAHH